MGSKSIAAQLEEATEIFCDKYCKYPVEFSKDCKTEEEKDQKNDEMMDTICVNCPIYKLI